MNGDKADVTAQAEVSIAGMIAIEHRTLPFLWCNRRDEQIVPNLDLHWAKAGHDFTLQKLATDNVTPFNHHHLALGDVSGSE